MKQIVTLGPNERLARPPSTVVVNAKVTMFPDLAEDMEAAREAALLNLHEQLVELNLVRTGPIRQQVAAERPAFLADAKILHLWCFAMAEADLPYDNDEIKEN